MESQSEKIQDYLEGHLEGEDLIQFEERLKVDSELRNLLFLQREVYEILNKRIVSEEIELRGSLEAISNNFRHKSTGKTVSIKKILSFVAAACILIIGTMFFFNLSDNDLYELPTLHSEIVRGNQENVSFEEAISAFNQKDYDSARNKLEKLSILNPEQVQYSYYIGLTYVGSKNWTKAIETLMPVSTGESVFAKEASYYLAIAYYEDGDRTKALGLLKDLESNKELSTKVNKLLNKFK